MLLPGAVCIIISTNGSKMVLFNKWFKDGSFQNAWVAILQANKAHLDLSCLQLDGSHTIAKQGGEAVGYQGRKKANTSNALFFADKQGLPIAMAEPQAGNHRVMCTKSVAYLNRCASY
jgi:hypothetical protein